MPSKCTMFDRYYFRLNAKHETKFHTHADYEINYFYDGSCKLMVGERCIDMAAGSLLIMDGMTPHGPIMQESCTYTMLRFNVSTVRSFLVLNDDVDLLRPFELLRNHCWRLTDKDKEELEHLLRRLEHLHPLTDPISVYRLHAVFLDLLLFICGLSRKVMTEQNEFPAYKEMKVRSVMKYIDDHYMHELSMDMLSRQACLSKFYLARLFKQLTGLTVFEYVNRQRITQAKLLLLEERSTSVTEICFRVGFKELAHFSKNFKQLVGVSPEGFRKSLRVV